MAEQFRTIMEVIGTAVDAGGVVVVVVGALLAFARFGLGRQGRSWTAMLRSYRLLRQDLGRAILLGLELLVAGDIIRTVVVSPTLQNVVVLALIVVIRTFLSMALQLEVEGRWPWQSRPETSASQPSGAT